MKRLPLLLAFVVALSSTACAGRSEYVRDAVDVSVSADQSFVGGVEVEDVEPPLSMPLQLPSEAGAFSSAEEMAAASSQELAPNANRVESIATTDNPATVAELSSDQDGMSGAEQDADALYPDVVIRDPWERYNRRVSRFNGAIDRRVLRPLAVKYNQVVPVPVRSSVSRFFNNLNTPATAVNQLLQGRPAQAAKSFGRFTVNTTIGVGGIFDPATRMGLPQRGNEDFGQTLAKWGWRDSRYLVLPLFGPRTVRDSFAMVGDRLLSPSGYVNDARTVSAMQLLEVVDTRVQLLPLDAAREEAYDEYVLIRDAWAQRRNFQIEDTPKDAGD